ncbi:hypothetical protein Vadar_020379 [Vaccinium darrowii]|uniref:Uncharacterized protein n=1 Tax=Vaccinium darrowii TaxID=229202 RepID=A0ACB7YXB9_9ERIC|nr:hypothetical protein Vadar_020379 [Vaccinium darrowii]
MTKMRRMATVALVSSTRMAYIYRSKDLYGSRKRRSNEPQLSRRSRRRSLVAESSTAFFLLKNDGRGRARGEGDIDTADPAYTSRRSPATGDRANNTCADPASETWGGDRLWWGSKVTASVAKRRATSMTKFRGLATVALVSSTRRASIYRSKGIFFKCGYKANVVAFNALINGEGMYFMMDRGGDWICYIQFPQRFEGIDPSDRYANHNTVFFDGSKQKQYHPFYVFRNKLKTLIVSYCFHCGVKTVFNSSDIFSGYFMNNGLFFENFLRYEDKTEWARDRVGRSYGSVTEDVVTGYRMHNLGWQSVYCITKRDALRGTTPINLTDGLQQILCWATGFVEIFFNRNNPLLATHRLKFLQRVAYFNVGVYPFTSIFLVVYCFLPALSLFCGQFIVQSLNIAFLSYLLTITVTLCPISLLEVKWSGIALEEWWRNEQFWVIGGSSAHLVAVMQWLLKVIAGIEISLKLTTKSTAEDGVVKWTSLFLIPLTYIVVNLVALIMSSVEIFD